MKDLCLPVIPEQENSPRGGFWLYSESFSLAQIQRARLSCSGAFDDVEINHGGRNIGMAQQILDGRSPQPGSLFHSRSFLTFGGFCKGYWEAGAWEGVVQEKRKRLRSHALNRMPWANGPEPPVIVRPSSGGDELAAFDGVS